MSEPAIPPQYEFLIARDHVVQLKNDLVAVEAAARSKHVGIWKSTAATTPSLFRRVLDWIQQRKAKGDRA